MKRQPTGQYGRHTHLFSLLLTHSHRPHHSHTTHNNRPEDMAHSLLKMISNNVAQIAYLNALRYNVKVSNILFFFVYVSMVDNVW